MKRWFLFQIQSSVALKRIKNQLLVCCCCPLLYFNLMLSPVVRCMWWVLGFLLHLCRVRQALPKSDSSNLVWTEHFADRTAQFDCSLPVFCRCYLNRGGTTNIFLNQHLLFLCCFSPLHKFWGGDRFSYSSLMQRSFMCIVLILLTGKGQFSVFLVSFYMKIKLGISSKIMYRLRNIIFTVKKDVSN